MKKFSKILILLTPLVLSSCDFSDIQVARQLSLSDEKAFDYYVGEVFDNFVNNGGLKVNVIMSDNSTLLAEKGTFTYEIVEKNNPDNSIDPTKPFTTAGSYVVTVSRGKLPSVKENIIVKEKEDPEVVTLSSISASGYKDVVYQNETYTFDGVVTATYSDGSTKNVTSDATIDPLSTARIGSITRQISYTESNITKNTTYTVTVKEKEPEYDTISVEEAVEIIDGLEMNVVSDKEYYVRGITANVEMDANGFNGGFLNSNLKFRSIKGNGVASTVDEIEGKEVVIFGYLENYNSIYQIPYLPATASPTGSKYNGKLIEVKSGGEEEIVDVTNVSISPVNKTLQIGEQSTLLATVLPQNATNKTLTWTSSKPSVCTVSNNGEIKGISEGTAVITATSSNNISATSNITVKKAEVTPVEGDKYEISFNHFESDGQTELTTTTIKDQVTSGLDYVDSFISIVKAYKGMEGLKIGSSTAGGSIYFTVKSPLSASKCKEIIIETSISGTRSKTVNVFLNDNQVGSGSSGDEKIDIKFDDPIQINNVKISTSGRAYISKVTFICGEIKPVPVTAISLPSSKAISTGNSETLSVTYTPSDANTGRSITWKSNNTSVATVTNGVVYGVAPGTAIITATSEGGFTANCTVTVSNIAVTGVTISSTAETLKLGSTKQLSATVSPSNATIKTVTWSSSNSAIASVDSNGLVTANAVGNATITVKTTDGNKSATCAINVSETKKDAWTVLIYMCGADLESESGLATSDIKEILSVKNQPDDVNIVIETGGAKSWSLSSSYIDGATKIDSSKLQRWHVENKKLTFDESLSTYTSMGSSSTLQSFVEYGINEYPAEKTGVIFWNHGGAMYGCCYDEKKSNDSLSNSEMKSAFSKALSNTGSSKLEFVGYDTCLTQVQDIAEFNSNYFNYMIASEEAEVGEGWDYDTWVDDLYAKKETSTILTAIVDGFIKDNGGASSYYSDQTLSWLDLSQMAAYKSAFESFASALKSQLSSKSVSKSTFANWMDQNVKAFAVDADSSETYYCLFDVKDMLNKLSKHSTYNPGSSYINAVLTAFSNLVKYSVAQKGAGNAYGLGCIYSQGSSDAYYIKQVYTSSETNFSNWLSFCKTYSYLA